MNKAGFIVIAVSTAVLLSVAGCADLDKLDGTRTMNNLPPPGRPQVDAVASEDESAAAAKASAIAGEEKATHGVPTRGGS